MTHLQKQLSMILLSGALVTGGATFAADVQDKLPDIGTAAGGVLSINQELAMGDFYTRQLRGHAPLINDPLLLEYVNKLGQTLVSHADSVRTPFHFYWVRNDQINAFAFFGGNIVLHSSLLRISDDESQLASVIAHEISHITQRHLARAMEDRQRNMPLTWVGALGSVLLAMANPQAGMAALTGTLAGAEQSIISFTQANEQEADRIGIQVLANSGFDPEGMPDFMQKLADQARYATKPPEMLLTHPLPESRLSDARSRANQLSHKIIQSSQDYFFAKVRAVSMYSAIDKKSVDDLLNALSKGSQREKNAAQYGRAIRANEDKKPTQAQELLQPLLTQDPNNVWYIDLMTDIDLALSRPAQAISRLENILKKQPKNRVLNINLANAYLVGKRPTEASKILNRYTYDYPDDANGWELLAQTNAALGKGDEELAARAESLALAGKLEQAIKLLSTASRLVKIGSLSQARYDARVDQLRQLELRFQQYQQ